MPSEDLQKYFEALSNLVDETTKLIEKEIQHAEELALKGEQTLGEEELKIQNAYGSILVNNFMNGPKSLPRDIKTKLYTLCKDLIMNEMYDKHRSMFRKIAIILDDFIQTQHLEYKKDMEEITYFMDANDDPEGTPTQNFKFVLQSLQYTYFYLFTSIVI